MTTAVVCIMCVGIVLMGCMILTQGVLSSADTTALSTQQLSIRQGDIMRTHLTGAGASLPASNTIEALLENSGQSRLYNFDKWDCIVQYYDSTDNYYVKWLPYNDGVLGNNEWQNTGIFYSGRTEVFEPGILNPQERLGMKAQLSPPAGYRAIDVTLVTANGIAPVLVCGPPVLTAHTEAVSLGGTIHYMLKGWSPADGAAVTETTDGIPEGEAGRWPLYDSADPSISASHLFPLSGVSKVNSANWTVNYHGRASGWASETYINAFLSIDVIIRQADGAIRSVLATDVARAGFSNSDNWTDTSASFTFPGYDVLSETDYLEVAFFGVSEGSGPEGTSYLKLIVDNAALPVSGQTRIQGLSWS
jgi:hypothetical protein